MKKIINEPTKVVDEMLNGLEFVHSDLVKRVKGFDVIQRTSEKTGKVAIISGGGSGHEPAHAGFVGEGMLSAAICGAVFTSPTPDQILEAIKQSDEGAGVFTVIKNYSGDVMNFEMAKDLAEMEGIKIKYIVSHDDISIEKLNFRTRHRGVAGTILLHKILGYYALNGASLDELEQVALKLSTSMATLGVATKPANLPNHENDMFKLAPDTISYGIGIHGEEGYRTEKFISSELLANELINKLRMNLKWKPKDPYILLINNLGATTRLEELIFSNDVLQLLDIDRLNIKFTS